MPKVEQFEWKVYRVNKSKQLEWTFGTDLAQFWRQEFVLKYLSSLRFLISCIFKSRVSSTQPKRGLDVLQSWASWPSLGLGLNWIGYWMGSGILNGIRDSLISLTKFILLVIRASTHFSLPELRSKLSLSKIFTYFLGSKKILDVLVWISFPILPHSQEECRKKDSLKVSVGFGIKA